MEFVSSYLTQTRPLFLSYSLPPNFYRSIPLILLRCWILLTCWWVAQIAHQVLKLLLWYVCIVQNGACGLSRVGGLFYTFGVSMFFPLLILLSSRKLSSCMCSGLVLKYNSIGGTFFRRSLSYFGTSLSPCVGFSSECQRVKTLYSPIARHFVPAFSRSLDWQLSAEYPPVVKCSEWKPVEPICFGKVELAPANFGHGL